MNKLQSPSFSTFVIQQGIIEVEENDGGSDR